MSEYTLYIDESETFNNKNEHFFVMSGVIIKNVDYPNIEAQLSNVKKTVWNNSPGCENYILHEKEVTEASKGGSPTMLQHNKIFKNNRNVVCLYNELSKLFSNSSITILGVCIDKNKVKADYGDYHTNHQFTIAIQLLIEHYCMFLIEHGADGDICYESMQPEQNRIIQQRIFELKALGTMYYSPAAIQDHVKEIKFVPKTQNLVGLQLADFVPNALGRYAANMKPKNADFAKNIRKKLYKSTSEYTRLKYGFKILS